MRNPFFLLIFFSFFFLTHPSFSMAEDTGDTTAVSEENQEKKNGDSSLKMLQTIMELKKGVSKRFKVKKNQIKKTGSETEKEQLTFELEMLDKQLSEYNTDFKKVATGVDIELFHEKKEEKFDWESEVIGLIEPGIKEIKRLTVKARYKAKLKDERTHFENLMPIAKQAVDNIELTIKGSKDKALIQDLKQLLSEWKGIHAQMKNKLEMLNMQLTEMENEEKSFIETSQASVKNFFRTRGLYLTIAVLTCVGVIFLFRLASRLLVKYVKGYDAPYRPFHLRVISLSLQILTFVFALLVVILVFFMVEDWVLLSLTIIFVMGLGWAVKNTVPRYLHQSRLMLNIGAVREGERLMLHGVPWLVKRININSELENPSLGVKLRVPIEELFDKMSKPFHPKEPWFPCRLKDWVILSDGTRGGVISLSHETVEMVLRGGARKSYRTSDFLSLSPLNISVGFRLKVTFGISYDHQEESTGSILDTMTSYIEEQINKEGYTNDLVNLRVEFQAAGGSSLDIVIIADFNGDMAPLYNRLNRAIQRWCVDVCTQNNWGIPFPQLQIHK